MSDHTSLSLLQLQLLPVLFVVVTAWCLTIIKATISSASLLLVVEYPSSPSPTTTTTTKWKRLLPVLHRYHCRLWMVATVTTITVILVPFPTLTSATSDPSASYTKVSMYMNMNTRRSWNTLGSSSSTRSWSRMMMMNSQHNKVVPIFHIGKNLNLRFHIEEDNHNAEEIELKENQRTVIVKPAAIGSVSTGFHSNTSTKCHSNDKITTVGIPNGGDTTFTTTVVPTTTDLSDVASIIRQEFHAELISKGQQNRNDIQTLLHQVTMELQTWRQEQQNIQQQQQNTDLVTSVINETKHEDNHLPMNTESMTSNNATRDDSMDDDETFVDATSVPDEMVELNASVEADALVNNDLDNDDVMPEKSADEPHTTTSTTTVTMNNDSNLGNSDNGNDDYLDLDDIIIRPHIDNNTAAISVSNQTDTINSLDVVVQPTKKQRKRKKSRRMVSTTTKTSKKASNIQTAVSMDHVNDNNESITEENDDNHEISDLLPSTTEVLYHSLQRFLITSLAAVFLCILYIVIKHFVSITLGLMLGMYQGAPTTLPKP